MKCLAIGDAFIPVRYFNKVLEKDELFDSYDSYSFLENLNRNEARGLVREMETKMSEYRPIPEEVMGKIADIDVVFIHLFPISRRFIENAPKLRYIVTARGGVENIDVEAAKERGIHIINCPGHNAYAVAEYAIGLMLAETRNITRADVSLHSCSWRERYPNSDAIPELRSCKVGIVGFGTIGRLVAERLKVFGSEILVNDPYVRAEDIEALGYSAVSLDEMLENADIVTLHGRLPAGAPPIIGEEQLRKMKKTAILINTARAVLVDMDALEKALREKQIMGAALDVFPKEPFNAEYHPMSDLDNVILSNHRGGDTIDSYIKAPEMLIVSFRELLNTGKTRCMVC